MEAQLGRGMPPQQRLILLQSIADSQEVVAYKRPFSPDELEEFAEESTTLVKSFFDLQEEKKAESSRMNLLIKEAKRALKENNTKRNAKEEDRKDNLYKVVSHKEGMVGFYNEEGMLVKVRKMLQSERQVEAFSANLSILANTGT